MAAQPVTVPGRLLLLTVGGGEAERSLALASKPLGQIYMHNLLALGHASVKYLASKYVWCLFLLHILQTQVCVYCLQQSAAVFGWLAFSFKLCSERSHFAY